MADAVKELVIRIKRDSTAATADQRAYHAAERKAIQKSLTDAEVAEKAKTELIKRENRQRIQVAAAATKTTVEAAKAAEKAKADAGKKAASDILAATRQRIAESKRLEKEMFAEGARLAADAVAREKQDARNAATSAKLAFDERKKQLDAQKRSTDEAAAASRQMTRALLGTQVAGAALNAVKGGIDAIAQSAADAKARITAMNAEAAAARFADREVAALTGNKPTVAFSASLAGDAAQAGVSPEVYRNAQTAFQSQAGQFVGNDDLSKISQEDAADLLKRVSSFSASQGVDVADSARLMGTIIGKSGKGTSKQDLMTTFGKVFKGVQLATGDTGPLLSQLSQVIQEEVGEGGSFKNVTDALPLIRVMAERDPGEASTYGRSLIRGLREANMDPKKMAELGLTKGMSFMDQVKAVDRSASAVSAAGGDEGEFLSKYFKDIRQFGAVRTALNAGTRGGGFARSERDMAKVSEEAINRDIQDYLAGEEGQAQSANSRETQARLEQASSPGALMLQAARKRASTSLEASGDLNRPEGLFGSIFTATGRGSRKEQEETALVGTELRQRLEGYKGGREYLAQQDSMLGGSLMNPMSAVTGLGTRGTPESKLVEAFNKLAELQKQQIKATQDLKGNGSNVPVPAPGKPPAGPGRP